MNGRFQPLQPCPGCRETLIDRSWRELCIECLRQRRAERANKEAARGRYLEIWRQREPAA